MSLHWISRRRRPLSGFTLMEMLIVVSIIILLLVVTLPRVKYALDESKVRESSRQLNSYMSLAKSRAASTGRPCGLFLLSERLGDPLATPGVFQCTQLYLAEVPPPYSGDVLEARAIVINDPNGPGNPPARPLLPQQYAANGAELVRWRIETYVPATNAASLPLLVTVNEPFAIRFDHKGPLFPAYLANDGYVYITGPIVPPQANGLYNATTNPYAGYQYEIIRAPRRIGAPLALPRGTTVDLTYSGFGNSGANFYSANNYVLVMFAPDGRVNNVTYQTWNSSSSSYVAISDEAPGTVHFLVGRPEKVGLALNQSNLWDQNALWVSVGRLTGSVVTTENAPEVDFVFSNPATGPEQQAFLTIAREYAITQDVKGGR